MINKNPLWENNLTPFKRHDRPYTENEFKKLYYSGMTITDISLHFSIGRKKVQNDMKRFKVKSRTATPRNQKGKKNSNWKGDDAGYSAMHRRLYHSQPKKCEACGTTDSSKRYQWANLTGEFQDPSDYKRMCESCHSKHDNMEDNFNGKRKC